MTVSYTAEVATCKGFGCFVKLLFRWKGSIYKLVWPDLFLFLGTYFSLSVLYRFFLTPSQQKLFEQISTYCENYGTLIPVSFVLGFYVSIVVGRWWDQYKAIPWPDPVAVFVSASIHGQEEKSRLMRRTIMRYCCLSLTMCFTLISARVKKRFPTLDHLIEAGLLLENEKEVIESLDKSVPGYSKTWLPIIWAASIVTRARKEGKIRDDFAVKTLLDELNKFRGMCGMLISYDWISVPLVYTQVVTLAVYSYFLSCVMGRQWLSPEHPGALTKNKVPDLDLVFPIFTTLQFFFYMGWLKVAESLLNPFGDDDDDFELNWIVDRNLQVSYLIVDEMHHEHPELLKDQYWDEVFPQELPYTIGSEQYRDEPPTHSTSKIQISKNDAEIITPSSLKLDELNDSEEIGRRPPKSPSKSRGSGPISRERNPSMRSNASQSTLAESASGKMSRAGSITSVFKRMFSREREHNGSSLSVDGRMGDVYGSGINVNRNILDDVIPELDENMTTIVSTRGEKKKPTVQDIFGPGSNLTSNYGSGGDNHPRARSTNIDIPDSKHILRSEFNLAEAPLQRIKQCSSAQPSSSCPAVLPEKSALPYEALPHASNFDPTFSDQFPGSPPNHHTFQSKSRTDTSKSNDKEEQTLFLLNQSDSDEQPDIGMLNRPKEKIASRVAKTLGFPDKDESITEQNLLSDISRESNC